ncbi:KAP P-loop domain protein [Pseudomonas syringae pv. coriandricola]|uniref:KAP P-loop domain protein n=1 Tax=Pseudomonas syringae pv. coriandricola TaxID=264453 RepID=A0A3M4U6U7_9PSED|nr:P-loop NTPase fold protein [Pseudomonas syringae group genomosp. 3]RMR34968.1 KAP P-loop domain protein [Pseudomonas syringae pv. coriandricola]RMU10738.1 KAP P-loop domain protein [Pseudomonas syringae pv. coriandricola]
MRLKSGTIEIPQEDIYQNDKLSRQKSVSNLAKLLRNVQSPLVFSVNGPWGAGKTTYMKMLNSTLSNTDAKSIYFSAWETDFAEDPLIAFIGEMNAALEKYILGDVEKSRAWGIAKAAGVHILKRSFPVGIKVATAGLLDLDKFYEDEASKLAEALTKDAIDNYSKSKEAIALFKSNIAKVLASGDGTPGKMFIFVDELDRCRPTYAIELLERVKHLLDVEGLVFILAMDKSQLAHSVKAVYGTEFDALGYLKRFIDVEFTLPRADPMAFVESLLSKLELDSYFAARTFSNDTKNDRENLLEMLKVVTQKMSLRDIEQLVSKVKLVSLTIDAHENFYIVFILFLIIAKDQHSEIYRNFAQDGSIGTDMTLLIVLIFSGEKLAWTRQYLEGMIIASKMHGSRDWAQSRVEAWKAIYHSDNQSPADKENAGRILEVVDQNLRMGTGVPAATFLERIDMLSEFVFE